MGRGSYEASSKAIRPGETVVDIVEAENRCWRRPQKTRLEMKQQKRERKLGCFNKSAYTSDPARLSKKEHLNA